MARLQKLIDMEKKYKLEVNPPDADATRLMRVLDVQGRIIDIILDRLNLEVDLNGSTNKSPEDGEG